MLRNYFKTAFRHLLRSKSSSSINIVGLTLGMTCAFLTILFVKDEMSFDRFHQKAPQLYRLNTTITNAKDHSKQTVGTTGQVQGPAFKSAIPEITDYVRIMGMNGINVSGNNKSFAVKNIFADETFFGLFSFQLLYGNSKNILSDPYSIVLSEETAIKFFGTTNVVGKFVKIEEGRGFENLTVTGVVKNIPTNSSIQFDVIVPFKYLKLMFTDYSWLNQYLTTFILLKPHTNPTTVEQKFTTVFESNARNQLLEAKSMADQFHFGLQPITNIHLHPLALTPYESSDEEKGLTGASTITYSYILIGIVAFILLMACVNFINLNIADSMKRAKEIGIRKIVGSSRRQIVSQFLIEASILCFISYLLAIVLSKALLPVFDQLADKKIAFSYLNDFSLFIYGAIVMLICIFIAGLYPALVLSLFKPAQVLYNKQKLNGKNLFGKSLIVLQFTLAISLVIATVVYYSQMNFISNKDLGYDATNIIKIHLPPQRTDAAVIQNFRNELLREPSIKFVSNGDLWTDISSVTANDKELIAKTNHVDEFYLPALKIPLKEGRNFSKVYGTDSANAVIVNETFARASGWGNIIGHQLMMKDEKHPKTIIGVIKDYHYGSLKEKIAPQVLSMGYNENVLIKIEKAKTLSALPAIEKTFREIYTDHYYQYQFLDTENAGAYQNDKKWQQIISYASMLAILICCIGLFGLTSFAAHQRIKEIGIRKVLGASVMSITALLSKDFLKLVFLAILIASPVAYYFMHRWLQDFAYRINISWWMFALTCMLVIIISIITVSFQAIKAAIANPVKSLRTE